MKKNVNGQFFIVFAYDVTTGLAKTGDAANISAAVNIDGAGSNALADTSATEISASLAAGYYIFSAAQAETNGDSLLLTGKSTTSNIVVIGAPALIYTTPANFTSLNVTNVNTLAGHDPGGALPLGSDVTAVKAKTDNLPASPAAINSPMTLTSGERSAVADALLDRTDGVESGITVRQALRAIAAKAAGLISGAGTGTEVDKALGNSGITRMTFTVDSSGNISAVSLNL